MKESPVRVRCDACRGLWSCDEFRSAEEEDEVLLKQGWSVLDAPRVEADFVCSLNADGTSNSAGTVAFGRTHLCPGCTQVTAHALALVLTATLDADASEAP